MFPFGRYLYIYSWLELEKEMDISLTPVLIFCSYSKMTIHSSVVCHVYFPAECLTRLRIMFNQVVFKANSLLDSVQIGTEISWGLQHSACPCLTKCDVKADNLIIMCSPPCLRRRCIRNHWWTRQDKQLPAFGSHQANWGVGFWQIRLCFLDSHSHLTKWISLSEQTNFGLIKQSWCECTLKRVHTGVDYILIWEGRSHHGCCPVCQYYK